MIETLTKWVGLLAPFMAPYPSWVKIAFSIFVLSGATWFIGLVVAAPTTQKVAEPVTPQVAEAVNPPAAAPTAWLTIKGVTIFGYTDDVYIRVTATVNDVEYTYPSLSGVKWLQVGPEMAPQTFQIPVRDTYRIRFSAKLRDPIAESSDLASVEEQRITGKTNGVAVYDLRFVRWQARSAAPSSQVRYTISQGAP
jgi:hypothetical protein